MHDSDISTHPALEACRDLADYQAAVRAWAPGSSIPLLGTSTLGLPDRMGSRAAISPTPDPTRVVLALDEPHCLASAGLLARASGRSLEVVDEQGWLAKLDALLEPGTLASLTLVAPAWNARGEPEPAWLARILAGMRERHARVRALAWGMLVATDPATLARLVGKALLQPEIIARYAGERGVVFTTGAAASDWIHLPVYDPHARGEGPLTVVDDRHVVDKTSETIVARAWSMMFFKGHGRAYCALQGHLCGARPPSAAPESALATCVLGMDCASPRDGAYRPGFPAFPRIDPRRYDTPVMVMDCCGTGNWSFPSWAEGIPSVSLLALAGAASGIITGDQVTMTRSGGYLDVLWALGSSATLGEALARLDDTRPEATARLPYFLLGDPELPAGRERWPGWFTEAPLDASRSPWRASLPIDPAPFVGVRLPESDLERAWTSFVRTDDRGVELRAPRLFQSTRGAALWTSLAGVDPSRATVELQIEHRRSLALPAGLVHAAARLDERLAAWGEGLRAHAGGLRKAADRIGQLAGKLRGLEQRAIVGRAQDFEVAIELAERGWRDANLGVLRAAIESFAAGGLWPYRMWSVGNFVGESRAERCPYCGLAPTLLRRYFQPPEAAREQWECVQCALIQDRPAEPGPRLHFHMPDRIALGETVRAEFELDNPRGGQARVGAGMILVDGLAHGVITRPLGELDFTLAPGESFVGRFELALPEPPTIAHLYWARALILLDGEWLLASRPLRVGGRAHERVA
ncbi:hypothetical protein ACNOYE_12915 [Nannocystaceae bacterium ST9]